ncbi:MAG TPA: VOC family protein [Candidatus Limiplasma sp.]|nr:VOC family protein [Candidatus Limiplasma sp.]HPS81540.1 VOC family protein [Candidatus Limiplasma sp.]
MRYQCALIAVKDVKKSLAFYQKWFGMEVEVDLGWNIGLKGGLALQEHFPELVGLPQESLLEKSHNMELYFDCENLDETEQKLLGDASIEWVHPIKEYPWKQRVIRIYDPDHHIIEIGESMPMVFKRLISQGKTLEETALLTQHPLPFVRAVVEGNL